MVAIVVVVLIIAIVGWIISTRNSFVRLQNTVEEAFSTMDVHLKKRWDLIPNLVETVKGYASHEKDTLQGVIAARGNAMGATTPEAKMAAENALSGTLKSLFALQEAYPELKANQQFNMLQDQLKRLEDEIASSRKYYNATVKKFNDKLLVFPSNIIANSMKLTKKTYFETAEGERENVKVKF
ncbi:MAG: LemA family protein [Clostridiales bacterium]|nr:LemA family protein [Clostridiales bacterium]